jgi:hypothetical protein
VRFVALPPIRVAVVLAGALAATVPSAQLIDYFGESGAWHGHNPRAVKDAGDLASPGFT